CRCPTVRSPSTPAAARAAAACAIAFIRAARAWPMMKSHSAIRAADLPRSPRRTRPFVPSKSPRGGTRLGAPTAWLELCCCFFERAAFTLNDAVEGLAQPLAELPKLLELLECIFVAALCDGQHLIKLLVGTEASRQGRGRRHYFP